MIISTLAQAKNEKPKFSEFLATHLQVQAQPTSATTIIEYHGKCELLSLIGNFYTNSGNVVYRITCDDKVYTLTDKWKDSTGMHWLLKPLSRDYFDVEFSHPTSYKIFPIMLGTKEIFYHAVNNSVYPLIIKENTTFENPNDSALTHVIYNDIKANNYLKVELVSITNFTSSGAIHVAVGVM